MVRVSSNKTIFDKGYRPNWTKEHFTVSKAVTSRNNTKRRVYKLVDYNDEDVKGSWYPEELHKISDNLYESKMSCGGVLYLTAQENYLSNRKVGQKNTTRK